MTSREENPAAPVVGSGQPTDAERELESYKWMIGRVHQICDEHGIPKPPENEPGMPWRMLWLLRERAAVPRAPAAGERDLGPDILAEIGWERGDDVPTTEEWESAKARVMARAAAVSAARPEPPIETRLTADETTTADELAHRLLHGGLFSVRYFAAKMLRELAARSGAASPPAGAREREREFLFKLADGLEAGTVDAQALADKAREIARTWVRPAAGPAGGPPKNAQELAEWLEANCHDNPRFWCETVKPIVRSLRAVVPDAPPQGEVSHVAACDCPECRPDALGGPTPEAT